MEALPRRCAIPSLRTRSPSAEAATIGDAARTRRLSTARSSSKNTQALGAGLRASGRIMTKTTMLAVIAALAVQPSGLDGAHAARPSSGRAFHELNLDGLPNQVGLAIVRIARAGTPYVLEIRGTSVVARPGDSRLPVLSGRDLVGLQVHLRDSVGARSVIEVAGVGSTTYWAAPLESVPTYTLTYTSATHSNPQPLCTANGNDAILFTGDRYDAERKTITATGDATAGWFNIACAGTA